MASETGTIITRFAPSPTGYLHLGGARTALFNWLYARHHGGKTLLRIEDTDKKRSTQDAIDKIIEGLDWLGLDFDAPPMFQSDRAERHAEVALKLLENGHAYRCYATSEELEQMRAEQRANKQPMRYDGRWRDREPGAEQEGAPFTVRLKVPKDGETAIDDAVQGRVTVKNEEIDDYILLRADGTPTHGSDGAKLSKRHGAVGVEAYRDELGILPEALFNYLLRLGWGHGDREEITREEAIELFDLDGVGRSPARFDIKKLQNLNGHYIREADDARLAGIVADALGPKVDDDIDRTLLAQAMPVLKTRAKDTHELAANAAFLFAKRPLDLTDKAAALLDDEARERLAHIHATLVAENDWTTEALEATTKALAERLELGLGKLAQPLRAALTGSTTSPGIFDVLALLGKEESLARIEAQAAMAKQNQD